MFGTWRVAKFWNLALVILLVVGCGLRLHRYWQFPVVGETQDEVAWTWLGSSLLASGTPSSWSYFSGYQNRQYWQSPGGSAYEVVTPVLDHPPMFSLLPGSVHFLKNREWMVLPSMKVVRLPVVLLAMVNLGLFSAALFALRLPKAAILGSVGVLTLSPTAVWLQRLVVAENLLMTWWLLLVLVALWVPKRWRGLLLFLVAAALPLTKVAGLALVAGFAVWLWVEQRRRLALLVGAGGVFGVALFATYAAYYDWSLFLSIQTQQAGRDTGLLTLLSTLWLSPTLVAKPLSDGWWWIALTSLLAVIGIGVSSSLKWLRSAALLLGWSSLAYIAFVQLSVGEHTIHGWYRIPLLPLVATAMGVVGWWLWQQRSVLVGAFALLAFFPTLRLAWWSAMGTAGFSFLHTLNVFALVMAGGLVSASLVSASWQRRAWYTGLVIGAGVLIIAQVTTVLTLTPERYWQDVAYWQTGLRP